MTVESVEKRERRLKRERNKLERFRHATKFLGNDGLHHIVGFTTTWDAVRRVAGCAIGVGWVQDVPTAWAIVSFVEKLPDGPERLRKATEEAIRCWEEDLA